MDEMRPLEREANRLEKRVEGVRTNGNKDLRKELRQAKVNLGDFEVRIQATTMELRRSYQNIVMGEVLDYGIPMLCGRHIPRCRFCWVLRNSLALGVQVGKGDL